MPNFAPAHKIFRTNKTTALSINALRKTAGLAIYTQPYIL